MMTPTDRTEKVKEHFKNKYLSYEEFDKLKRIVYWENILGDFEERNFDNLMITYNYKCYKSYLRINFINIIIK